MAPPNPNIPRQPKHKKTMLKKTFMKMIIVLREEMKNSQLVIKKKATDKKLREINKSLK